MPDMAATSRRIVEMHWVGMDPPTFVHTVLFADGTEEIHAGEIADDGDGCWIGRTCDVVTRNGPPEAARHAH